MVGMGERKCRTISQRSYKLLATMATEKVSGNV